MKIGARSAPRKNEDSEDFTIPYENVRKPRKLAREARQEELGISRISQPRRLPVFLGRMEFDKRKSKNKSCLGFIGITFFMYLLLHLVDKRKE